MFEPVHLMAAVGRYGGREPLFRAHLPAQVDGYVWFEETLAVKPLPIEPPAGAS